MPKQEDCINYKMRLCILQFESKQANDKYIYSLYSQEAIGQDK